MGRTKDLVGSRKIRDRKTGSADGKHRSRGRRKDDAPAWLGVGLISGSSAPGNGHYGRLWLSGIGVEHGIDLLLGIDTRRWEGGTRLHAQLDWLRDQAGLTGGDGRKLTRRAVELT